MRRAAPLLASGLAAAAAGALLYAPVSSVDRPDSPATTTSAPEGVISQTTQPQLSSSAETEPNVSAPPPPGDAAAQDVRNEELEAYERAVRRRGPPPDQATMLAELRRSAMREVQQSYLLLLDGLGLTPQERRDLIAVLVELQVDSAWSDWRNGAFQKRGRTIGAKERHERIAAAIGGEKLDELLLLEVNSAAYWETQQITSLLERKQAPLTREQRDGVLGILVQVRERYPETEPDLESHSVEYIEKTLAQMDDFDRHVVELATSVLSATQVAHLSEEYQWMARQRIDLVELQKKRRTERPGRGVGWTVPARWNPR
jgi:hypothetical protein